MPEVLNARSVGKVRDGAVYVGRPSVWGNPYFLSREMDRATVLDLYEEKVLGDPDFRAKVRAELKGKDLICWCAPKPCHADLLLAIANEGLYA